MNNDLKDILSNSNKDIDNQQLLAYLSHQLSKSNTHEVEKSMADVRAFALSTSEASRMTAFETSKGLVWANEVTDYVNEVMARYDAAATMNDKLAVIAKEYWLSLWGSGIEAYNLYRRTGKPNQQPALDANPGPFASSVYYPTDYISRNKNAKQKASPAVHVFWDTNPAGFVK